MTWSEELAEVRGMADPVRRAQRLTELMVIYQQRSVELTRLRKLAIEEAHDTLGIPYSDLAGQIGITKGRVSQIKQGGPKPERIFFGVGPVTIVLPAGELPTDRRAVKVLPPRGEATKVTPQQGAKMAALRLLARYDLATTTHHLKRQDRELPEGDLFVVAYAGTNPLTDALLDPDLSARLVHPLPEPPEHQVRAGHTAPATAVVQRRVYQHRVITLVAGYTNLAPLAATHAIESLLPRAGAIEGDSITVAFNFTMNTADGSFSFFGPEDGTGSVALSGD